MQENGNEKRDDGKLLSAREHFPNTNHQSNVN